MSTLATFAAAYDAGAVTPVQVAEAFLAANPTGAPWHAFRAVDPDDVMAQAKDSQAHIERRERRGPLEGALIGVKDFFAVTGYRTMAGTRDLEDHGGVDSLLVSRLRAAGAVVAGKTHCTELGLSPLGTNPAQATPVNPHSPGHLTGGSSSGTGAAVSAGLTPAGVGSDGGGSIRIPSALCGTFGIKPSWGVVPTDGAMPVGWWSLDHVGPLARCTADLVTMLSVMGDVALPLSEEPLRYGVDWSWWGHPDPAIDGACRAVAAELNPRSVSVEHIELARDAGYATAISELAAGVWDVFRDEPERLSLDIRAALAAAPTVSGVDYVRAQQARAVLADAFDRVFDEVDVLLVPSTAIPAPARPSQSELEQGVLDLDGIDAVTAYAFPANLCGLPAASVPVGLTADGRPVGLQVVGRRGADATVLSACAAIERAGLAAAPVPASFHDPLAA